MKVATALVVDDDTPYLRLLRFILEAGGRRVVTATSREEALNSLVRDRPVLVILDLTMPGMDGFEVLSRVQDISMIPVLILTAKGEEADKVRALRLGANDYVTKPFSAQELLARVEAVLAQALT